jgi:hypothetical protein
VAQFEQNIPRMARGTQDKRSAGRNVTPIWSPCLRVDPCPEEISMKAGPLKVTAGVCQPSVSPGRMFHESRSSLNSD